MESEYVLYSASWCSNCGPMEMWLDTQDIKYSVIDIDEVPEGFETPIELRALPSLGLNGKVVAVGDNIKSYVELLNE